MEFEERAADPLAGGLVAHGYQCGMTWGAALAAGAQAYRLFGTGPQAEARAIIAAQRMIDSFRAQNQHVNCRDITGIDPSSPTPGMVVRFLMKSAIRGSCLGMAARYAQKAFDEMNAALTEERIDVPPLPVSCAALVARKMGASERHAVMAAGLAGGIGLSGEACGALGAAIWITGIKTLENGGTVGYKAPAAQETIDRFKRCAGSEFECSKLVGRRFGSVADHACYVREGGCLTIIEALTAHSSMAGSPGSKRSGSC